MFASIQTPLSILFSVIIDLHKCQCVKCPIFKRIHCPIYLLKEFYSKKQKDRLIASCWNSSQSMYYMPLRIVGPISAIFTLPAFSSCIPDGSKDFLLKFHLYILQRISNAIGCLSRKLQKYSCGIKLANLHSCASPFHAFQ